ncbi:hypothetical protein DERF_014620 [Dermatophagoides farinae]|uniref:Uncharacterized protein n=1 Tax=Dermatophagoides farinae TaxID=6954 RepID=A0A922HIT9_DERFA|nr:hypothetical protein DERF_014620 [Dermatophagoides farinae]
MSILIYPTMAINVSILTKIHNSKESKSTELNILTNHKFQSKRSEDKPNQIMKITAKKGGRSLLHYWHYHNEISNNNHDPGTGLGSSFSKSIHIYYY